jgi:hypothetical protein
MNASVEDAAISWDSLPLASPGAVGEGVRAAPFRNCFGCTNSLSNKKAASSNPLMCQILRYSARHSVSNHLTLESQRVTLTTDRFFGTIARAAVIIFRIEK